MLINRVRLVKGFEDRFIEEGIFELGCDGWFGSNSCGFVVIREDYN